MILTSFLSLLCLCFLSMLILSCTFPLTSYMLAPRTDGKTVIVQYAKRKTNLKRSRASTTTPNTEGFELVPSDAILSNEPSKLAPLSGTLQERQANYNEKSLLQRNIEDLLAPTPQGQEPKAVKLAKQITWVAVIMLVLAEIVVSIKVGGMPFELGSVRLPTFPNPFNMMPNR